MSFCKCSRIHQHPDIVHTLTGPPFVIAPQERQYYDKLFDSVDKDKVGEIRETLEAEQC